jgi:hypothetical protein
MFADRIAVTCNVIIVAMAYTTSLSGTYRTLFTAVNVMVSNSMACNLFRRLRFNLGPNISSGTTSNVSGRKNRAPAQSIPLALRSNHSGVVIETGTMTKALSDQFGSPPESKSVSCQSGDDQGESFSPVCKYPEDV